jgi:DHA2 family multidrug resistance protein-like MFS transporter
MPTAIIEHADGLPLPQRNWAISTIALGLIMAVMDGAIANVALPTIARDLDASPAFSIWIVNGYQLAITISLLPLDDRFHETGIDEAMIDGTGSMLVDSSFGKC